VESFLQQLPVEALWGVGPVTARKLRQLGVVRVVDLRSFDFQKLHAELGSIADWLRQLSYGDDPRPVVTDRSAKSSSSENTYAEDLLDLGAIRAEVERMARENAQWLARKRLTARTVTIKVRYADFATVTRSHTLSVPTDDPDLIASWAMALLERTEAGRRPVRLLGARVQGLIEDSPLKP
jgi:DNA polymerase IV